ncbi:uncharacterized protein LOC106090975 [Stomoxys calcitrans]|uniref:Uncharacterized protein n=1 Tax=Stomoxys calcitrans TaxID=35570 RepID=A0A1I8PDI0_STOCA|nr:uncharacterized protein LOC106090975 [Stomoxys calcitrans]
MISSRSSSYFIAIFSTLMYAWLIVYNTTIVIKYRRVKDGYEEFEYVTMDEEDDAKPMKPISLSISLNDYYTYLDELELYVLMLTLSLLLIVGVNLRIHQAMAPWLVVGAILVVFGFIFGTITWNSKYTLELLVVVAQAACWLPVYSCYKEFRENYYFKQKQFVRPSKYSVGGSPAESTKLKAQSNKAQETEEGIGMVAL